jgi:hypothetical protein
MLNTRTEQPTKEKFPKHEKIQEQAYDLDLKSRQDFFSEEYWLIAEGKLKKERAKDDAEPLKTHAAAAGAGGVAKRNDYST